MGAMPHTNIDTRTRSFAKRLRRGQTDAERRMWRLLRPFRDDGIPIRRQAPIGPYVADFAWLSGKLPIEIDGGQHNEVAGLARDTQRTDWLKAQGFEVLRFWNNDVMRNGAGCQEVIAEAISRRRTLSFLD
jgi:very-short-patch-repair endonuclease